jgi:hypothetical protein
MQKLVYHALDGDAEEVEVFGVKFKDGKAVDVSDDVALRLKENRFFKPAKEKPAKEAADDNVLKAVHIAGGRFVIKQGDKAIKEGLNKADADAFNALSDEDKAAYVE